MYRRAILICLTLGLLVPFLFRAGRTQAEPRWELVDGPLLGAEAWENARDGRLPVMIHLSGPTALDIFRSGGWKPGDLSPRAMKALDGAYATLAARQSPAKAALEALGVPILSIYDTAANGFQVLATRTDLAALAQVPGVRKLSRAPEYKLDLAQAVPMIGGDKVAETPPGLTGKGVNIAIIDTGVDFTHRNLGGLGRDTDYQGVDPSKAGRDFPTKKVIGGYDFAGTNYPFTVPAPDDNPLDENSHGTHVSGIAAGNRGNAAVYHGVAPDAKLVALKVFGRDGGTNLANDAIEWAIEANLGKNVKGRTARVDVINMSLGAPWAYGVAEDQAVVRRATEAGIVVVAAAGNDGNAGYVTGAPGAAPHAISVASSVKAGEKADQVLAIYDGMLAQPEGFEAAEASPDLAGQIALLREVRAPLAFFGSGCDAETPKPDVTDKIALVELGACSEVEAIKGVDKANAKGALFYGDPILVLGIGSDKKVKLPAFMVSGADGRKLKRALDDGKKVELIFSKLYKAKYDKAYLADVVSSFSSRGPSRQGAFKPDISAPGSNIVAPYIASGTDGASFSGTSMASPMVAGSAALMVERLRKAKLIPEDAPISTAEGAHPLTALDVGALLANNADAVIWDKDNRLEKPVPLARQGAGRVNLVKAAKAETILRAGTIASIDFGLQVVQGTFKARRALTVRNIGGLAKHYRLATAFVFPNDQNVGVTYQPSQTDLELAAGEVTTVYLDVEAVASGLKPFQPAGGQFANTGDDRVTDAEADAFLTVTEVDDRGEPIPGGDSPHLPIYFLPRGAPNISVPEPDKYFGVGANRGDSGNIKLQNLGGQPGQAEVFLRLATDPLEADVDPRLNIDQVGVRAYKPAGGERMLEFAIHSASKRHIPFEAQATVYLDTNQDGRLDWMLYNADMDDLRTGGRRPSGRQDMLLRPIVRQVPIQPGGIILQSGLYADMNLDSRIVLLRTTTRALGLPADSPVALNAVVTLQPNFEDIGGAPFDVVPDGAVTLDGGRLNLSDLHLTYDEPAQNFTIDSPSVRVLPGAQASVQYVRRPVAGNESGTAVLVCYPLNAPLAGDCEVVTVQYWVGPPTNSPPPPLPTSGTPPNPTPTRLVLPTRAPTLTPDPSRPTTQPGTAPIFLPRLARAH